MEAAELKEARRLTGMKGYEMARELGISAATLSRYECGHAPVPRMIELAVLYLRKPKNEETASAEERLITALKEVTRQ